MTTSQGLCTFVLDKNLKYQIKTEQFLQMEPKPEQTEDEDVEEDMDVEDDEQTGGKDEEDTVEELNDDENGDENDDSITSSTKHHKLFTYTHENMFDYSPKIAKMFETILDVNNNDLHFIYTRWVIYGAFHIEGYLQAHGYQPYLFDMGNISEPEQIAERVKLEIELLERKIKEGNRYYVKYTDIYDTIVDGKKTGTSILGLKDNELNQVRINTINYIFSHDANKTGKLIKVLIGTRKAEEGLDLRNIRQVYIVEPWWNMVKPEQAMGRAIRYLSHYRKVKKINKEGNVVETFEGFPDTKDHYVKIDILVSKMNDSQSELYLKSTNSSNSLTTDEVVLDKSLIKLSNSIKMQNILNQSAIDCGLFPENNSLPCSNYFGVNETGYCFHSSIRNELVDNDFGDYHKIKRTEFKEIIINGQSYLKENQAQNIYIKFEYDNHTYTKLVDLILYKMFSIQSESNPIIIPDKAYVRDDDKYLEIDYPCFQIISI